MKFSIRDLFLVTMIVALAVGWWVDRSRLEGERKTYNWLMQQDKDVIEAWVELGRLPASQAPAPNPPNP